MQENVETLAFKNTSHFIMSSLLIVVKNNELNTLNCSWLPFKM